MSKEKKEKKDKRTLYQILGVRSNAKPATIKKAYRKKAQEHHPDKGGDVEEFHRIKEAYKILSDPASRTLYDRTKDADVDLQMFESMLQGLVPELVNGILIKLDYESFGRISTFEGAAKKILSEKKMKTEIALKDHKNKTKTLNQTIASFKEGKESIIFLQVLSLQMQLAEIGKKLETSLAVIEYLLDDVSHIRTEVESTTKPTHLLGSGIINKRDPFIA